MEFTVFTPPRAKRSQETVDLQDAELERKAQELVDAGWKFEVDGGRMGGLIFMDCCNHAEELANAMIPADGPDSVKLEKIRAMVEKAHERWLAKGRPPAIPG
jgi:hypothetical protein